MHCQAEVAGQVSPHTAITGEDTMNRTFARIEEIFVEGGVTKARVVVNGRRLSVALTLMLDARVGDEVVLESGFAFPVPSRKHKKTVEESGAEV